MPKIQSPAASNGQNEVVKPSPMNVIRIPEFNFQTHAIKIVGVTSLICHAFPDKEKKRMIGSRLTDESTKEANEINKKQKRAARPARDPQEEYLSSLYPLEDIDGYGFPAIAFKRAIIGACRQVSNLDMTMANRIIFVKAPHQSKGFGCVKIEGKPSRREDVVRLSGIDKPPDIRWRGEFKQWSTILEIEFNASMISIEGIFNLIKFAGKCEGVGESRPSSPKKSGDNGQFQLVPSKGGRP
jgi:hypothetical protein